MKKIEPLSRMSGRNTIVYLNSVKKAQNGEVVMFVHPKGNIAILDWEKFNEITEKADKYDNFCK